MTINTVPPLTVVIPDHEAQHLRNQFARQQSEWLEDGPGLVIPDHLTSFEKYVERVISIAVFGNPQHER